MFYKTIIQGRLSFGTQKSFDKVVKMFEYRTETYYKSDILVQKEDIFNSEELTLVIPRYVGNASDKNFKNTVSLLAYCSQFAIAGSLQAWMIDEGKVKNRASIQPESDRSVVQQFNKGDKLFREKGKSEEALDAFSKTIEGYSNHGQAYERRGWVNLRFKNFSDALYDFNKAIALDDTIAFAYYGRGLIAMNEGNTEEAIADFQNTIKRSVALESVHWRARLRKAECLLELEEWDKAAFELKFFTKRVFESGDSNVHRRPRALCLYGITMYELEEYEDAIQLIDEALVLKTEASKDFNEAQAILYRGLAKQKLRKKDAKKDIEEAARLGDSRALEMIKA